jgi:hypothetical protein
VREACRDNYPNAGRQGPALALLTALRALGLPYSLRKETAHLVLRVDEAAKRLDAALRATHAVRVHLVPLDQAADLPSVAFGSTKLCRLSADELRSLVDVNRLRLHHPNQASTLNAFPSSTG